MIDVLNFVKKASEKSGFIREKHEEMRLPTDPKNICICPFFGDLRSLFILSSLLLRRFKEEDKASKYFIFASWPGFADMFPFVDEYWGMEDQKLAKKLYADVAGFKNSSKSLDGYYRLLNQYFFEDFVAADDTLGKFYDHGLTDEFWKRYGEIRRFLPSVPSSVVLGKEFNKDLISRGGFKVFIYPACYVNSWSNGKVVQIKVVREFWVALVKRLLDEKFVPVICRSYLTFDLSTEFTNKCVYVADMEIGKMLASMRATGCVLDVFSGISRFALAARCPFLSVDERTRYNYLKEFEIDDLCGKNLLKKYIFTFPTIISNGNEEIWNFNIFNLVINKLNDFIPLIDRDHLPSTGESVESISYDVVRKKTLKRLGVYLMRTARQ